MGFRVCRVSVGAGARGAGGGGGTGGDLRTGPGFGKSVAIMATTGVDNCVKLHFHLTIFIGNLHSPNTYPLEYHCQSIVYPLPQLIAYCIQSSCVHDFSFDANSVSFYCSVSFSIFQTFFFFSLKFLFLLQVYMSDMLVVCT